MAPKKNWWEGRLKLEIRSGCKYHRATLRENLEIVLRKSLLFPSEPKFSLTRPITNVVRLESYRATNRILTQQLSVSATTSLMIEPTNWSNFRGSTKRFTDPLLQCDGINRTGRKSVRASLCFLATKHSYREFLIDFWKNIINERAQKRDVRGSQLHNNIYVHCIRIHKQCAANGVQSCYSGSENDCNQLKYSKSLQEGENDK